SAIPARRRQRRKRARAAASGSTRSACSLPRARSGRCGWTQNPERCTDPMRVLIVEDEKPLRDSIVEQLQQQGFNVDAAADGEEGLYCGREYALDLAIVDLGLPKLNGMEIM